MNWNTNPKIDINEILVIIFAVYSLSLLLGCTCLAGQLQG